MSTWLWCLDPTSQKRWVLLVHQNGFFISDTISCFLVAEMEW